MKYFFIIDFLILIKTVGKGVSSLQFLLLKTFLGLIMQDSNVIGQNVWERRFILQNKSVARAKTTRFHFWMFFSRSNVMNHNLEYSRIITNLALLTPS